MRAGMSITQAIISSTTDFIPSHSPRMAADPLAKSPVASPAICPGRATTAATIEPIADPAPSPHARQRSGLISPKNPLNVSQRRLPASTRGVTRSAVGPNAAMNEDPNDWKKAPSPSQF